MTEVLTIDEYHKASKYKNIKTEVDGIKFDSRKEARRYSELKLLLRAGEIFDLERQIRFQLIEPMRINGKHERAICYVADFRYTDKHGKTFVEDVKGIATDVFKIKYRLMKQVHGIEVLIT